MKLYKNLEKFEDDRGVIQNLLPEGVTIQSVLYITGNDKAVRGNHWHMRDHHYCYVLSGIIKYEYMENGSKKLKSTTLGPGTLVHTPPGEKHRFRFVGSGVFLAMATEPRSQDHYEKDTQRQIF